MAIARIALFSTLVGLSTLFLVRGFAQECPAGAQGIFIANMKVGGC